MKAKNGKEILAWVHTRCPYCQNAETIEVTELDDTGKNIVRCAKCKERIPVDSTPPGVKEVKINEAGGTIHDKVSNK
jgi:DNA-directed RNA polymerase subunit RPC12/RpoP